MFQVSFLGYKFPLEHPTIYLKLYICVDSHFTCFFLGHFDPKLNNNVNDSTYCSKQEHDSKFLKNNFHKLNNVNH